MANTISYPKVNAKSSDLVLGTSMPLPSTNDSPRTVNFSISQINGLANSPDIATAKVTITDAQIRTLGTVPVEILPAVTGYIYEILGVTTQSINSGGLGDEYDWDNSGDGVIYGRGFLATEHRVEIPNANLPDGGLSPGEPYVATPIAGSFRGGSGVEVSTTLGVNPTTLPAQTPVAQWVINITYRLIQAG
jgi:hypothetical protein